MDKEMQKALEADGEKLRQLTGEDHGPFPFPTAEASTAHELIEDYFRTVFERGNPKSFADDLIAALHAAGYKILAREPTDEMIDAVDKGISTAPFRMWRAMWDAAP